MGRLHHGNDATPGGMPVIPLTSREDSMPRHALLPAARFPRRHAGSPRRGRRVGATAALTLVGVMLATSPAAASWIQTQTSAEGKVVRVRDGDTVDVDVWGDGTSTPQTIRNTGIQAMETGQCHAAQATKLMTSLAAARTVRLTARYASTSSLGRPVRYVDSQSGSVFTDTQLPMLNAGQALALTLGNETSRWRSYMYAQQKAERTGANLWDTDYCGSGPQQANPIKVWVNYDGDGDETLNPNTEWVRIQNQGSTTLSLTGWWLRSAAQDYLRFPAGTAISAHSVLTVYVGKGTRTATKLYWGFSSPHFPNSDEPGSYGSGAYLFDPQGDLRSHTSFPCLYACSDSRAGQVAMKVNYDAPGDDQTNPTGEYVALTLKGTKAVDLSYTTLWSHGNTREFGGGTILKPGERMIIHMGKGTNTRLNHYWGKSYAPLTNSGGNMVLRTTNGIRITCSAWGTGRC
jgi:endonuclease YncB( thermonuclease family)